MRTELDDLTDAFGMAEQALASLELGVAAEVSLIESPTPVDFNAGLAECWFGWKKISNEWRLYVRHGEHVFPIGSVSRRRRCAAAVRLDALYDALLDATEESVVEAKRATEAVLDFAGRIKRGVK